jgi:hypothetical protein
MFCFTTWLGYDDVCVRAVSLCTSRRLLKMGRNFVRVFLWTRGNGWTCIHRSFGLYSLANGKRHAIVLRHHHVSIHRVRLPTTVTERQRWKLCKTIRTVKASLTQYEYDPETVAYLFSRQICLEHELAALRLR